MKTFSGTAIFLICFGLTSCKKENHPVDPVNTPPGGNKWMVTTIAGDGQPFFADGPAQSASFRNPIDVAVSPDGIVFVADPLTHRIRKIKDGIVSTLAGKATAGSADGADAEFTLPSQVMTDQFGNVYTLDIDDPRVRKISSTGFVSSLAGNGMVGFRDGPTQNAEFGQETSGLSGDAQGNFYVVDFDNRRIRKITTGGEVVSIAGNGTQGFVDGNVADAEFFAPSGIAVDKDGNIYVGDEHRVRKISSNGLVSTIAGGVNMGFQDGPALQALFYSIEDLVIDDQGNIFLTDQNRVREITRDGMVTTIAGGIEGYKDGNGATAQFYSPAGLGIDRNGNIYVADVNNYRIRKISKE